MTNLVLNFPDGYKPNPSQVKILKGIEKAVHNGKKFIVINAPTGSGKSFIPKAVANAVNGPSDAFKRAVDDYSIFGENGAQIAEDEALFGVYAVTITKSLQDQYKETFDDTGILKGQSNYPCMVDDSLTVDVAPCLYSPQLKQDCWRCNKCLYYNDRNEMLKNTFSTLNYSMYFSLPDHLKKRKVLVLDEASELEEQLVSQFTCEIDFQFLMKAGVMVSPFPTVEKSTQIVNWLSSLIVELEKATKNYVDWFSENKKKDAEFQKKKSEYSTLTRLTNSVALLTTTYYDSQYILERVNKTIKFIPLKVDGLSKYIFDNADHVILLSATIIDHPNFASILGIKDYDYLDINSEFDSDLAPIYTMAKQKINYQNLKDMLPVLAKQVRQIMEEHKDEKGIIHTHTQQIADYIRENVKSDRLLCREPGVKNEELLELHKQSKEATVLVSPSMTYGVDLKGDLAKFQIILKAPWLPTKDVRVEKMMKIDKNWYSNKMLCTLVQACGRGIRSKSDVCQTYILDGSIYDTVYRNKSKLPKFFLDRFQ